MFTRDKMPRDCSTCFYWSLVYNKDTNFGDLGECHRFPPSLSSLASICLEADYEKRQREFKDWENQRLKDEKMWHDEKEKRLEKIGIRIANIQDSINTCGGTSIDHWKQELEKELLRKQKIEDEIYCEGKYYPRRPEEYRGFKQAKGEWILTASNDFCGEWKG
jgi:hypothetical protein